MGKGSKNALSASDQGCSMDDWITKLAKQTTGASTTTASTSNTNRSKAERIQQRLAKKQRREDRKAIALNLRESTRFRPDQSRHRKRYRDELNETEAPSAKKLTNNLASAIQRLVQAAKASDTKRPRPYTTKESIKYKRQKWDETHIQPRPRDYGGIGLARPSLFLSFTDPAFPPKLEEEFAEHIPGFFGKTRTKAMKKQLDKNMLWKQLAEKKNRKINGKKLSSMTPDERVEEMIKMGMI
jgi:exonuclease VII large subunit